ncbi:MAG: N-acetylneuraminate synthase family protein, partial [Pseudonocardiaceae bacterium]
PLIMSTGVREEGSVDRAIAATRRANADVVLLHSVFGSPSAPHEQGLSEIRTLQDKYEIPVGFSDHTIGYRDPDGRPVNTQAMARDAIYEKADVIKAQIRLPEAADRAPGGPHRALTPDEFGALVAAAREAEHNPNRAALRAQLITRFSEWPTNQPRPSELHLRDLQRTVIPTVDIPDGTELTLDNVTTGRGGGIPARNFTLGSIATADLAAGRPVKPEQIRPPSFDAAPR